MDIDLCNQNISELVFNPVTTTEDEQLVAATVECLRAEHNQIHHISGLGSSFQNLTTLLLRDNNLGQCSTAPHEALRRAQVCLTDSRLCDGLPSWIAALPSSLHILDVSGNHLRSFLQCTCGVRADKTAVALASSSDAAPDGDRFLRHACPLTLSLFFPHERFPFLTALTASENAFSCSAQDSQAMEDLWESHATTPGATVQRYSAVQRLDVSECPGLFALNPFVVASATEDDLGCCLLESVRASATAVNDLTAVAALGFFAPRVSELDLSSTPICGDLLHASPTALSEFLEDMIGTLVPVGSIIRDDDDGNHHHLRDRDRSGALPSRLAEALSTAAHELAFHHLDELASAVTNNTAADSATDALGRRGSLVHKQAPSDHLSALRSCVYAVLLRTVIPSLHLVDDALVVDTCRSALAEAALAALASSMENAAPGARGDDQTATVQSTELGANRLPPAPTSSGWSALAANTDAGVRTRVLVPDDDDAETPSESDPTQIITSDSVGRYQRALEALQPALRRMQAQTHADANAPSADPHDESATCRSTAAPTHDDNDEQVASRGLGSPFVPSRLTGSDKVMFEELCREADGLAAKLAAARESRRALVEQTVSLREQLVADRALVRDQRQEVLRLRTLRDTLAATTASQRALVAKRRKEVLYGTKAIASKEAAARNREAIADMQRQQRAERRQQRAVERTASQNSNFTVQYAHGVPPPPPLPHRKTRSEILREEAIQQRMALHAAAEGPFTYEPKPFRTRRAPEAVVVARPQQPVTPKSPEQLEEEYLGLYHDVAEDALSPRAFPAPSVSSGGGGNSNSSGAGSSAASSGHHRDAERHSLGLQPPPPPPLEQSENGRETVRLSASFPPPVTAAVASRPPLSPASSSSPPSVLSNDATLGDALPLVEKDLSTLSLTELFEAAAAVRRKQMALQQLHQHWAPTTMNDLGESAPPSHDTKPSEQPQSAVIDEAPVNRALFDTSANQ